LRRGAAIAIALGVGPDHHHEIAAVLGSITSIAFGMDPLHRKRWIVRSTVSEEGVQPHSALVVTVFGAKTRCRRRPLGVGLTVKIRCDVLGLFLASWNVGW